MVTAYPEKRYQESDLRLNETGKAYSERDVGAIGHKHTDLVEAIAEYTYWSWRVTCHATIPTQQPSNAAR